jgi:serine/threonine-protein kinase
VLFRACDHDTGEQVAVKMLKPSHSLNPGHVARFVREMRIASTIRHPNTARVIDVGSDDTGVPFLVMELLHGRSLAQELEQRKTLPLSDVLAIAIPIAGALEAAHALGTVHRDIKPSNIFLCDDPSASDFVPKLLDFGIAKSVQEDFETDTGFLVGTPGYMAPEHAQYGECCPSTDIWGLGAVIYSCLAGHPPHAGGSVHEMLGKLVREPVPPLEVAGIGKRASTIIDRALARDPQRRYPSIAAFRNALTALADNDAGAPDETATFDAAELALARAETLEKDVARDASASARTETPARWRGRPYAVGAACVAIALLLSLAVAPTGTKLHAADRPDAEPIEMMTPHAAEVSTESESEPKPLLVSTDATVSDAALAASMPVTPPPRAISRLHRSRPHPSQRHESPALANTQSPPIVGPNPMDRRR